MRQIISTAVVAVVVGAVAGATMGAVAQTGPEATTQQAIVPAVTSINAHKVDGRHAVSASASRKRRAGKLVATNRQGYLPANIIKPAWKLMEGKPPVLADDQVGWDELVGTAPKITLTTHTKSNAADVTVGIKTVDVSCPTGKLTGGGFHSVNGYNGSYLMSSYALNATTWRVTVDINVAGDVFYAYVTCMTAEPSTLVARLTPAARNPKGDR